MNRDFFYTGSVTGKTCSKVQHFRVKITFYLLQVQYPWLLFLCLSVAVEKITVHWIALSTFRTTGHCSLTTQILVIIP